MKQLQNYVRAFIICLILAVCGTDAANSQRGVGPINPTPVGPFTGSVTGSITIIFTPPTNPITFVVGTPGGFTPGTFPGITFFPGTPFGPGSTNGRDIDKCLLELSESMVYNEDKTSYEVLLAYNTDKPEEEYYIIDNVNNEVYGPTTVNSVKFGPFTAGNPYSYTVMVANNPKCSVTTERVNFENGRIAHEIADFTVDPVSNGFLVNCDIPYALASKGFAPEYSRNGVDFEPIQPEDCVINDDARLGFSFVHKKEEAGIHYYRLKSISPDGNVTIASKVVSVEKLSNKLSITNVYPVPMSDVLNLTFNSGKESDYTIKIVDITGQTIAIEQYNAEKGLNELALDVSFLTTGNYFVSISDGYSIAVEKIVKN